MVAVTTSLQGLHMRRLAKGHMWFAEKMGQSYHYVSDVCPLVDNSYPPN